MRLRPQARDRLYGSGLPRQSWPPAGPLRRMGAPGMVGEQANSIHRFRLGHGDGPCAVPPGPATADALARPPENISADARRSHFTRSAGRP